MSTSADSNDIEEGLTFQPKFDASGLVTCVATDAATGDVLMVAHMNEEALHMTIASGEAWYFSRSRKALWRKGEIRVRPSGWSRCGSIAIGMRSGSGSSSKGPPATPADVRASTARSRRARAARNCRSSMRTGCSIRRKSIVPETHDRDIDLTPGFVASIRAICKTPRAGLEWGCHGAGQRSTDSRSSRTDRASL